LNQATAAEIKSELKDKGVNSVWADNPEDNSSFAQGQLDGRCIFHTGAPGGLPIPWTYNTGHLQQNGRYVDIGGDGTLSGDKFALCASGNFHVACCY